MLRMLRLSPISALLGIFLVISPVAKGDETSHGEQSSAAPDSPHQSFRPEQPGEYGKYRQGLSDLCSRIAADGRQADLYGLLNPMTEKDPGCIDCRPLINQWASVCRPKPARPTPTAASADPSEGEDPHTEPPVSTPTPQPARLPSLAVIDSLLGIARKMAEDTPRVEKTIQAIDKICAALKSSEGKSAGQREYFDAFAAYLSAPFDAPRAAIEAAAKIPKEEEHPEEAPPSSGTEGLFDH